MAAPRQLACGPFFFYASCSPSFSLVTAARHAASRTFSHDTIRTFPYRTRRAHQARAGRSEYRNRRLAAVRDRLNARTPEKAPLVLALGLLAACTGRVVVTGIGKSGLSAVSLPPPFPRPVHRPSFSIPWKEPTEIWGASAKTTSSLPFPIPVKRRS